MKYIKNIKLLLFTFAFLLVFTFPSPGKSVILPLPTEYQERADRLATEHESLKNELKTLEKRLGNASAKGNAENARAYQQDIEKLFALLDKLAENMKANRKLQKELQDLFTSPPPLKLARISGPTDIEGVEYNPNSAGFSRRFKKSFSDEVDLTVGFAVTYAPLEIIPGEPFHIEAEARMAVNYDSPDCSGTSPRRWSVMFDPDNIPTPSDNDVVAMSRADLNCQPGTVKLSLRFQPLPPQLSTPGELRYEFPYMVSAATDGIAVKPSSFGPEKRIIHQFDLPTRKSSVDLLDREFYKLDIEAKPTHAHLSAFSGPGLTFHYRPIDESIAFLPRYQFPEDTAGFLIEVPELLGLSLKEAKIALEKRRLGYGVKAGPPPPTPELAKTVATQTPQPGTRVKKSTAVNLTIHSNYVDVRTVPELVGLTLADARKEIIKIELKMVPKPGEKRPSSPEEEGTVARQSPSAGTSVKIDSVVYLYIYGPYADTITVPNVRKLTYKEAKRRLEAVGLSIRKQDAGRPGNRNLGNTAQKQEPVSGTEVSRGQAVSVWFYGQYVPTREEQVAKTDCSAYPGSRAYWDDAAGKSLCGCPQGYTWAADRTHCERLLPPNELCAKNYPGSVARGRTSEGKVNCVCPGGYTWAAGNTHCEKLIHPDELCARDYPSSVARGRTSDGKINCVCPQDYTWSADRTHCEKLIPPNELCARDYPGSIATGRDATGKVNCDCPRGLRWNLNNSACVSQHDYARQWCSQNQPGSYPKKQPDGRYKCLCPSGYVLGSNNRCVKKPTRVGGGSNRDQRGRDRNDQCNHLISQIKGFMGMYRNDPRNNRHLKSIAETNAQQARMLGCNQSQISKALGTGRDGGGSGSGGGRDRVCPPGYYRGSDGTCAKVGSSTFGQ
jgi:beta-lactam-binding protein with PASTA domain